MSELKDFGVWSEQFRPKTIEECILPAETKKMVLDIIATGNIPSFIFAGQTGTGKTSLAYAIAKDLGADLLYVNASLETSIDVIRDRVVSYSSTMSFDDNLRMILLDEVDGLSPKAMDSLKGIYEQFPNVRFVLTTNSIQKIIDPIIGRSVVVDFKVEAKERPKLSAQMMKRIITILKSKDIEFEPKVIAELVNKYFPDFRRTINELQRYASSGKIDTGILLNSSETSFDDLIKAMRDKNFKTVQAWVAEHAGSESSRLFNEFYEKSFEYFVPQAVPTLIVTLNRYDVQSASRVNQKINLCSCLIEIMVGCQFKD